MGKFEEIIYKGKKIYTSTIKRKTSNKTDYTLPDNVRKDIKRKHKLRNRYRRTNDKYIEKVYKQIRNKVKLDLKNR